MNYPQEYALNANQKLSPMEEILNEIECSLKLLAESIDRITMKTSDVRLIRPCDQYVANSKDASECETAPLIERLRGMKNAICVRANEINQLSYEIQL